MKTSLKVSLIAVMAGALALVLILGASIGSAAPNAALVDDLILIGNGYADGVNNTGEVNVFDVNSMSVVNVIAKSSEGSGLANNHGVLLDSNPRFIWNSNNTLTAGMSRLVKYDLMTMAPAGTLDRASADVYAFTTGLCGLEWNYNDSSTGKLWATSMSAATGNGGLYDYNPSGPPATGYVDNTDGAANGSTCGIAWNTSGGTAYAAAMLARQTTPVAWPGGPPDFTKTIASSSNLHMVDTYKAGNIAYVAAQAKINIVDISTPTISEVATVVGPGAANIHDTKVSHDGGFLYAHNRNGATAIAPTETGTLLVYDIGGVVGGTGTKLAPVLIGSAPDQGSSSVSCGTQLLSKAAYTGKPVLTLSKTGVVWGSLVDYNDRVLTVNYSVGNSGSSTVAALQTTITGSTATNGVTLNSASSSLLPISLGTIGVGSSKPLQLKYNVAGTGSSFWTSTTGTAKDLGGTTYYYPPEA
ncbi:MAG: hypothetical protein WC935_09230 [Thermoleophilia bacterium]